MYDNDSTNFTTDSSEIDKRRRTGDANLREANEQLLKENATLTANFQDALKISDTVTKLHKDNAALLGQISTLRRENDDLEQRLKISIQSHQELLNKLNDEKKNSSQIRGSDLNSMNKQIEQIKHQSKLQIDSIYEQLEEAKKEVGRENLEKRHLINQINNIIEESQRHFNTTFRTTDDLIKYLQQPPLSQEFSTLPTGTTTQGPGSAFGLSAQAGKSGQQDTQALQRKVKRLKKQLREEQSKQEAQEEDYKKIQIQLRDLKQAHETERNALSSRVELLETENKTLSNNNEHIRKQYNDIVEEADGKITKKTNELKSKKQQVKALKKQLREQRLGNAAGGITAQDDVKSNSSKSSSSTSSSPSSNHKYTQQRPNAYQSTPIIDNSLNDRINDLTDQITVLRQKKDETTQKLREAEDQIHNITIENSRLRTDNDAIHKLYDQAKKESDAISQVLTKREETNKEILEKQKSATKQPNPRVLKLQKQLDEEKKKVYTLQTNETKLQDKIDDLESAMRLLQQSAKDAKEEAKKASEELNDTRRKVETAQPPTADDLLPPSCYRCDEFDPQLSAAIGRIANNTALQPVSKVQNCFKTIRKYYSKQLSERDEALDQAFSENQTLSSAFHQFLVDASIALSNQAITLQDFFANNAGQKLVEQISAMRTNYADLKHQAEIQRSFANAFMQNFAEYISDPCDQNRSLAEVKDRVDTQKVQIAARSKKIHDLKAQLKNNQSSMKSRDSSIEKEREALDIQKREYESKLNTLNKTVSDLRQQNQNLTTDLETANRTLEETQMTLSQEQEDHNTTMLEEAASKEATLRSDLKKRTAEVKTLRTQIAESTKILNAVRAQLQQSKNEKKTVEDEYDDIKRQLKETEKQAALRLDAEKRNITASYDVAINELKDQCDKHRKDVEKMAAEASESDLRYATATQEISSLKKEKRKLECDIQTVKGQLEREKKLMETKIRAEKVQAESNYNVKLEEQKVKAEAEKRRLFALGADAFRNFFNPNEQIDERSFKAVLEKARDTIAKLQKSDGDVRRMLGASESQTTPDAVAQLLMSKGSC